MLDTVFVKGILYDGSGGDALQADIGVKDGKVVAVGQLADAAAIERIEIDGLIISPGFIDLHTHSDFTLVLNGSAESQVHQGVTTEVVGQCGFSCAPLRDSQENSNLTLGFPEASKNRPRWKSFDDYLSVLEGIDLGVNVAAMVGHGTVHSAVFGDAAQAPEPEDIIKMKQLVEQALDEGAVGFSTGLEYWPGLLATTDQLLPLCEATAGRHKLYATHVRNRDKNYDLGFGEALNLARRSGAKLQISHIQTKFGAPAFAMEHTLEMIGLARRHGVDVGMDVIPHDWNNTSVISILPHWVREGGTEATLIRLRDPSIRERIKSNPSPMLLIVAAGKWDEIVLLRAQTNSAMVGATFAEIGKIRNVDPYDALMDMLIEEQENAPRMMWATKSFTDRDIELALQDSLCAVISDTAALAPYGVLKDSLYSLSGYGWAARFLRYYVLDRQVLSLQEAIRRITSLPAERVGLKKRGYLHEGYWADVTVFSPELIKSNFTATAPRQYPSGIVHVMVNGKFAMKDGCRTSLSSGKVLRHG